MFFKKSMFLSMFFIVLIIVILFTLRPKLLFNDNGAIPFGIGFGKSILSLPVIIIVTSILLTLFFNIIIG